MSKEPIKNLSILQKFSKNTFGVFSFIALLIAFVIAVLAYLIVPDNSKNANQMHLSIHSKPIGFNVDMLLLPIKKKKTTPFLEKIFLGNESLYQEIPVSKYNQTLEKINYLPFGIDDDKLSKEIQLSNYDKHTIKPIIESRTFILGTDKFGRDLLSRLIIGLRISLSVGFISVLISLVLGLFFGSIAGFFGGFIDKIIMWFINVTWSIPTLLMVIAITLMLGKGFWQIFLAIGLTMWIEVARVTRGQVLSVKNEQYIKAASSLGFSNTRILLKHIIPNIFAPLIVICTANFVAAILIESGLSFLGIGVQPPTPSWGSMIKNHYSYIVTGKPFLALIPGIAIMFLVLAFSMFGYALRDVLDVKSA